MREASRVVMIASALPSSAAHQMERLLTSRQQELIAQARDLSARFGERAGQHDRDASFPFENFADLHRAGYLALTLPASVGQQTQDRRSPGSARLRLLQSAR